MRVSPAGNGAPGASTVARTYASTASNSASVLMRRNHSGRPLRYTKTTFASLHGRGTRENAKAHRSLEPGRVEHTSRRRPGDAGCAVVGVAAAAPKQANINPASAMDCHGTRASGAREQE